MSAPLPANEAERLSALAEYAILDTFPEQAYDDLTRLAAYICQTPIALVTLLDQDRQWFKSKIGMEPSETPRDQAFCAYAILEPTEVMVVSDATRDTRFGQNPLVTAEPHIRFYAGAPLVTPQGQALGTLCVIDRTPRELSADQLDMLRVLSRQVTAQLELRLSVEKMEQQILEQEQYTQQLLDYQQKIEDTLSQMEQQSLTDGLTGVSNRRAFQRQLDDEFNRARRHNTPLCLLMLDVDKFKAYNDSFGHPAGDFVLSAVAKLLREHCRTHDFVARYGGEEFAIILPATGREGALVLAERFRRGIHRAAWPHRSVTISVGGAMLTPEMASSEHLLGRADEALYQAKQTGRNRVCFVQADEVTPK